ncbi:hypothetical protein Scep_000226 [Stephania cephalantha]|uniref:RRM domain-containing protein n=1 Tax=Stephania cephalantha TaxID=152367 RepID=A0AAP0L6M9_9MAGN
MGEVYCTIKEGTARDPTVLLMNIRSSFDDPSSSLGLRVKSQNPNSPFSCSLPPTMADSPRRRSSRSPSPKPRSRSRSRAREWSRSLSRSRSREEASNPGNTLYVTGLSTRVSDRDLEDHFNKKGKVVSCRLVVEPRTRISRGFAFVTMDSVEDAERCIKHLNQSVLEGRYITVEKVIEVIVVDVVATAVMTMDIVGLQGDRHFEEVVIFLLDAHLMEVGQEGSDLGQFPILLMVARKGAMDGVLMCMQGENAL